MVPRKLLVSLASLGLAACAADAGAAHITMPGYRGTEYRVSEDGISNERVNISRIDRTNTFRGTINTRRGYTEIELRIEGLEIRGERAGVPIAITREIEGTHVIAHALYAGRLLTLHLQHDETGFCAFRYDEHEETRAATCANQPNAIQLPALMMKLPIEQTVLYAVVAFGETHWDTGIH